MKKIYALFIILSSIVAQNEYLVTLPATSYTEWVYYSFETHEVVDITNPESSLDWDIAMQRKHIRSNSGLAGIGFGGGYVDSTKTELIVDWDAAKVASGEYLEITNFVYENDLNDKKKQIFLLNKRYVRDIIQQFKQLVK